MKFYSGSIVYIQVFKDHLLARKVGGAATVLRACPALGRRSFTSDRSEIRRCLRDLRKTLAPGYSFRRPSVLLHFLPEHYPATVDEQGQLSKIAYAAGFGDAIRSVSDSVHTDEEILGYFRSEHWVLAPESKRDRA